MAKRLSLVLTGLLFFEGCASSSTTYVRENLGTRAASKGHLLRIENAVIQCERLSDGVACVVANPDCRVTMEIGKETSVFDLRPGDVFVLGDGGDWVMVSRKKPGR